MVCKSPSGRLTAQRTSLVISDLSKGSTLAMLAVLSEDVLYSGGQHVLLRGVVLWGHMAIFITWTHTVPLNKLDYGGIKVFLSLLSQRLENVSNG